MGKYTLGYISNLESTRKGTCKGTITFAQWRNVWLYGAYKKSPKSKLTLIFEQSDVHLAASALMWFSTHFKMKHKYFVIPLHTFLACSLQITQGCLNTWSLFREGQQKPDHCQRLWHPGYNQFIPFLI